MRNEERAAARAEQNTENTEAVLELPEAKEQKFKFKSIFTNGGVKKNMKKFGAKNAVVVLSLLLIAAAVYINWTIFGAPNDTAEPISGNAPPSGEVVEDYFAASSLERKQARDEAIEVLKNVAQDEKAQEEAKTQALEDIAVIADNIELESNIETLIKAKGFEECVAVINGDKASVVVKSDGLLPNELSQILEIIYLQANIVPANVTINEK